MSTEEAETIVQELGKALDVQRDWSAGFQAMLVCRTKPKSADINTDAHKKTVFGLWYYGDVNPLVRAHHDFAAVGKFNEHMHDLARGLAVSVRDDVKIRSARYKAYITSVNCFNVSVRKLLSEAWQSLRYTDPLTGVLTRAIMQPRLEEEQERIRRSKVPSCIGLMDLDHFKKVNDTHGHVVGDLVLKTVAGFILGHLRRYDQVFRYGGEEFLLLLPNGTPVNAKAVLDRLRQGIKRQKIDIGKKGSLQVSASFGVAELLPGNSVKDTIECADQALYEAKDAGRNQVHVWKAPS